MRLSSRELSNELIFGCLNFQIFCSKPSDFWEFERLPSVNSQFVRTDSNGSWDLEQFKTLKSKRGLFLLKPCNSKWDSSTENVFHHSILFLCFDLKHSRSYFKELLWREFFDWNGLSGLFALWVLIQHAAVAHQTSSLETLIKRLNGLIQMGFSEAKKVRRRCKWKSSISGAPDSGIWRISRNAKYSINTSAN